MIHDSFRVILNEKPAKLFRSGSFTVLNLLMMNGYSFQDILGRSGLNLTVAVNGRRKVFYGTAAQPASLYINKKEGKLSEIVHAGDAIDFIPAVPGVSAKACLGDIEGAADCIDITLNGKHMPLETPLRNGDIIVMEPPLKEEPHAETEETALQEPAAKKEEPDESHAAEIPVMANVQKESETNILAKTETEETISPVSIEQTTFQAATVVGETSVVEASAPTDAPTPSVPQTPVTFHLNGSVLQLPPKEDGSPYYLMDLIQYSGIDLRQPKGRVKLTVNGNTGKFQQKLGEGDTVCIEEEV